MNKDLAQIIKDNPNAFAIIDNDCWFLYKESPDMNPYRDSDDWNAAREWEEDNLLVTDGEVEYIGDGGYGSGNTYGGDILQALAQIVGLKVESV